MQPDWTVLLIGGSSATGKSYLARQLALHYQIPLMEIDDLRIAVQKMSAREKHPDLFYFPDHPDYLQVNDCSQLVEKLVNVAKALWPALNELITKHIVCHERVIFEGDGVLPQLIAQTDLQQVKSIFLFDTKEHLHTTDVERHRGKYTGEGVDKQAAFSFQYGLALEDEANHYHFPVVKTSPRETLFVRVLEVLGQ